MDRRLVIKRVLMGTTALVLIPDLLTSCEKAKIETTQPEPKGPVISSDMTVDLSASENGVLNNQGGYKVVKGIIIINLGTTGFAALASACTHEGSQVAYSSASNNIQCPSHGSVFSLTGAVVNGPAVFPLKTYTVSKSGNILTIRE
jgi:cytochrome b6-f complex iron-sulfur subunit